MDKPSSITRARTQCSTAFATPMYSGDPGATLCVEMYADQKEDLPPRMQALEADLRGRNLGYHYHTETDLPGQARIWSLREAALGLSTAMKDDAKSISFVEDTAVAPEKLSAFIGRFLELVRGHKTTAGVYAHASVGCLHVRPGDQYEDRGWRAPIRSHRERRRRNWCWNSAARCRASMATDWCAVLSCGRCSVTRCMKRSAR